MNIEKALRCRHCGCWTVDEGVGITYSYSGQRWHYWYPGNELEHQTEDQIRNTASYHSEYEDEDIHDMEFVEWCCRNCGCERQLFWDLYEIALVCEDCGEDEENCCCEQDEEYDHDSSYSRVGAGSSKQGMSKAEAEALLDRMQVPHGEMREGMLKNLIAG